MSETILRRGNRGAIWNNRPKSYRPKIAPKVAATKVPCEGERCRTFIAPTAPFHLCGDCYVLRKMAERERAEAKPVYIPPTTRVIDGMVCEIIWQGRGPLPIPKAQS